MSVSENTLENNAENAGTLSSSARTQGRRQRRKRRTSDDVIILDNSIQELSPPVTRRRRGVENNLNQSVVDLTCSTSDDIVDLTSPDPPAGNSPDVVFVSDITQSSAEEDLDNSVVSRTESMRCPICLEPFSKLVKKRHQIISTMCGHVFCDTCIYQSIDLTKKCPSCRCKLTRKKVHQIFLPV